MVNQLGGQIWGQEAARLFRRLRARDAKWILKPSLSSSLNNGGRSRIPRPREEAKAPCGVVQLTTRVAPSVLILRGCSLYVVIPSPVLRRAMADTASTTIQATSISFLQYQTIRRKQLVGRSSSHLYGPNLHILWPRGPASFFGLSTMVLLLPE